MSNRLDDARDRVVSNILELDELGKELEKPGLLASDVRKLNKRIGAIKSELPELREDWERQRAIRDARRAIPPADFETRAHRGDGKTTPRLENPMNNPTTGSSSARLRGSANWAVARGELFTESVYRPDLRGRSFFRDLVDAARMRDPEASERLMAHHRETSEWAQAEYRDVTSGDPGAGGGFIPPLYMGDLWIDKERAGRPLANAVRQIPLSSVGKTMDFPKVSTAPEAEVQAAEADAVNEVNFDSETYSVDKVTIAGQNDFSVQAFEWMEPGADEVILRELVKSYDSKLDYQLLDGLGSSGQHRGIDNVSGINTITFSSGGADDLLGDIYEAQSTISTQAPGYMGNAVVLHPRRAAWIASHRDTSMSLLEQGALRTAAVGSQNDGFAGSIAGLNVLIDPNITVTHGAGTNEDLAVYVVDLDELILAEGPLRTRVLTEVLSGTLQVRIQAFAFSAFAGGRRPKVITKISGAGLATPTFPST
jgi:HK97 family phage major capsid protein